MDDTTWGQLVYLDTGNGRITGNLHVSPQPSEKPSIIMLHGLGGNRHEHNGIFTRTASHFAHHGYPSIRFDFRGNGESDHDHEFMTLDTMKEDVRLVFEYLKTRQDLNSSMVYLFGLSLGGLVAAASACEIEEVKAAVLWEAPFNLVRNLKRLFGPLSFTKIKARGYWQNGMMKLNADFMEHFDKLTAGDLESRMKIPVLFIQGDADEVVTVDDAKHWQESFRNKDFQLHIIEGGDHTFTEEEHAVQAIDLTTEWLLKL